VENKLGKTLWGFDKVLCFGIMPGLTFYSISADGCWAAVEGALIRGVKLPANSSSKMLVKEKVNEQAK